MTRAILGFTGTRCGMSPLQVEAVIALLRRVRDQHNYVETHHGDCVGADAKFHFLCGMFQVDKVVVHPPLNESNRAFVPTWSFSTLEFAFLEVEILEPKSYTCRDHAIVDACDLLIGIPRQSKEIRRSGTWATIRYAIKCNKTVVIVGPNGEELDMRE